MTVATFTYGHSSNDFVEVPDPAAANQTIRPAPGLAVAVRDAYTNTDLPGTTSGAYGYLSFTTTSAVIRVSTDGFVTWKELYGEEGVRGAIGAGVNADQAAADSSLALATVNTLVPRVQALEAGGTGGTGSTFTGTVDWASQVANKPTFNAAFVGALATSTRGAVEGVAPLSGGLVPIGNLPVGTATTQVAAGSHIHATTWASAPPGTYCAVDETSAGVYPAPRSARADIIRRWRGTIRPTAAQGALPGDEWVNTGT